VTSSFDIPRPDPLRKTIGTRLHFLWSAFWAVLLTAICAAGYLITHLIRPTTAHFKWWSGAWGRAMFFFMGIRLKLFSEGELGQGRPCVLLANHQNSFDIPAVAALLPIAFGFVAKAELEGVPFLGTTLKHSPSVFVDRRDPRRSLESIRAAARQIREGSSVLIFPEGKRTYDEGLAPFMKGAFVLAVEAGVPLVPVTVVDSAALLDERNWISRGGTIHVVVGTPISLESMTRREIPTIMAQSREAIARHLPPEWRNPASQDR
jgi:1-acyl-sn-glycerol-3-phosphate acyltransferase